MFGVTIDHPDRPDRTKRTKRNWTAERVSRATIPIDEALINQYGTKENQNDMAVTMSKMRTLSLQQGKSQGKI
jgi:hypothetical protein